MLGMKHGLRMVQMLIDAGASASPQSQVHGSALHIAMNLWNKWFDNDELADLPVIIQLLLNAGGCVEQRDSKLDTALNILLAQVMSLFYSCTVP